MTNLQRIRKQKGLTQKQLAKKSGVSLKLIQKYETGERNINHARVITALRLSYTLNVPILYLMEEGDELTEIIEILAT